MAAVTTVTTVVGVMVTEPVGACDWAVLGGASRVQLSQLSQLSQLPATAVGSRHRPLVLPTHPSQGCHRHSAALARALGCLLVDTSLHVSGHSSLVRLSP